MARKKRYRAWKGATFWVLGAFCALLATSFVTSITFRTTSGYYISLTIAFILFLITGLLWISVAVAMRESE